MTQPTRDPSRQGLPESGRYEHSPFASVDGGTMGTGDGSSQVGHSLLRRLGSVAMWFRSDEGPPLTPDEVEERWRLLLRCGF